MAPDCALDTADEDGLVLDQHVHRRALLHEAHARPFHPCQAPARFLHFAFATDAAQAQADRAGLDALCRGHGHPIGLTEADARHHCLRIGGARLRWEQHAEFTTYTWEAGPAPGPDIDLFALMRTIPQPGPLLAVVDLTLDEADIEPSIFDPASFVMSAAYDGVACVATDFKPDRRGVVRFHVSDRGLSPMQAGSIVQRLLELETYRMLSLLGLLDARRLAPSIDAIERELAIVTATMSRREDHEGHQQLLRRLADAAAKLEAGAAASQYRFAASRAYAEIVQGRLAALGEAPCDGYSTFAAFMSRRLMPAMRTCRTMEERQERLSRKLARAAQLLRTRIDVELSQQNRDLLATLNERALLQLRLQQTVEGLSVFAISYYAVGLVEHMLHGIHALGWIADPSTPLSIFAPATLALAAVALRAVRR